MLYDVSVKIAFHYPHCKEAKVAIVIYSIIVKIIK